MNFTDSRIFLDTNFLAYIFDSRDVKKQSLAKSIFTELVNNDCCFISTQVLQELFNVLTRKLNYTKEDSKTIIDELTKLPVYEIATDDIKQAIDLSIKTQFTIYDSLILIAASKTNCSIVLTEDLNDGQVVDNVKIQNPFNEINQ